MKVISIPSGQITQADLQTIVNLRNRLESTQRLLARVEEGVLVRLVGRAEVEPGIHQAWLEEEVKGRCRRQRLEVR